MNKKLSDEIVKQVIDTAVNAGKEVLKIYNSGQYDINNKEDNLPLTIADTKSNRIICEGLYNIRLNGAPLPIISEEKKNFPYEVRKNFAKYWLVDPLDGTKEFISRNGEFTINIALVENSYPVFGVIYLPVKDILYYGIKDEGSFKMESKKQENIKVNEKRNELTVVQSRSHSSVLEDKFYGNFSIKERISAGSSLKFCMVAEGKADLYFRSGPTMEWDTAAGQAIVENGGGVCFIIKEEDVL